MICLTLPIPPSANHYKALRIVKSGGKAIPMWYLTKEAKDYKEAVAWYVRSVGVRQPLAGRVWLDIQFYPARPKDWGRRARKDPAGWDDSIARQDLDNVRKVLYDALKDLVFADDKMIFKDSGEVMEPDEHGPRVEVTIRQIVRKTGQGSLDIAAPPDAPLPQQQPDDEPAPF